MNLTQYRNNIETSSSFDNNGYSIIMYLFCPIIGVRKYVNDSIRLQDNILVIDSNVKYKTNTDSNVSLFIYTGIRYLSIFYYHYTPGAQLPLYH